MELWAFSISWFLSSCHFGRLVKESNDILPTSPLLLLNVVTSTKLAWDSSPHVTSFRVSSNVCWASWNFCIVHEFNLWRWEVGSSAEFNIISLKLERKPWRSRTLGRTLRLRSYSGLYADSPSTFEHTALHHVFPMWRPYEGLSIIFSPAMGFFLGGGPELPQTLLTQWTTSSNRLGSMRFIGDISL